MQISFLLRCEQEATYIERSNDFCSHIALFSPLPEKKVAPPLFVISVSFSLLSLIPFLFFAFSSWGPFHLFSLSLFGQKTIETI